MKKLVTALFIAVFTFSAHAQEISEEGEIKEVINTFFEGFHARDSVLMKSVVHDKVIMQSIGKNQQGQAILHHEDFSKFLKSIVSIPATTNFREDLHSYSIQVDGNMASAWTPYSLYVNDVFQHCGVNNFQLFRTNGEWNIIYLVDTRRKEGCEPRKLK